MNTSFLDYYKLILDRVSFNRDLFNKEYRKAMKVLNHEERHKLKEWIAQNIYLNKEERISA